MNKLITLIAIVVIAVGGWMLLRDEGGAPEDANIPQNGEDTINNTNTSTTGSETAPGVKEFTVEGSTFAFAPNTMTVNVGDTVKITFVNKIGFHDFVLDEFNVKTQQISAGQSETITFVADKAGTFEYYCSVGTHRQQGMVGTLTVI
ncbi:MAG: cupredoxin domain-containing protein [Minisyncoccota bacterium]